MATFLLDLLFLHKSPLMIELVIPSLCGRPRNVFPSRSTSVDLYQACLCNPFTAVILSEPARPLPPSCKSVLFFFFRRVPYSCSLFFCAWESRCAREVIFFFPGVLSKTLFGSNFLYVRIFPHQNESRCSFLVHFMSEFLPKVFLSTKFSLLPSELVPPSYVGNVPLCPFCVVLRE